MSAEETPRRLAARRTNPPVTIRPTASATPTPDPSPRTHPGDASTLLHLAPPSLTALTASNQLKAFIVDYCHANAFPDTAHAFARESHAAEQLDRNIAPTLDKLDRDGDLMQIDDDATQDWPILTQEELAAIRLRREIKDHILAGRIQTAIDLLKLHYPTLLDDDSLPTHSSAPCDPKSFFVPTHSIPPAPIAPHTSSSTSTSTSRGTAILRPTILSINLNLQAFVELIRTASMAVSAPSTPRPSSPFISAHSTLSHSHSHLLPTAEDLPADAADTHDSPMSASTGSLTSVTSTRTSAINTAISRAQLLYSQVMSMDTVGSSNGAASLVPGEKEAYLRELQGVAAMMAYGELSAAPESVRRYLDLGRREGLADLVLAAILVSENRSATSLIALAARQTTAIWSALGEWKVSLPTPTLPTSASSSSSGNGTKDAKVRAKVLLPPFDLHTFLNIPDPKAGLPSVSPPRGVSSSPALVDRMD